MRLLITSMCVAVALLMITSQRDEFRVESVKETAALLSHGSRRPLHPGDTFGPGDIITTGAYGSAILRTPCGDPFELFPDSTFVIRQNGCPLWDHADRWLRAVRTALARIGPYSPQGGAGGSIAVIAVRG